MHVTKNAVALAIALATVPAFAPSADARSRHYGNYGHGHYGRGHYGHGHYGHGHGYPGFFESGAREDEALVLPSQDCRVAAGADIRLRVDDLELELR